MDYELAIKNLRNLADLFKGSQDTRNEATTRLHLIDLLFFDCLGWSRDTCTSEESYDGEYADYTFSIDGRRVLIVEAKRQGDYFEMPAGKRKPKFSLETLTHDYPNLKKALEQVSSYCQSRGVPLAIVCNGHQLVAFLATRSDGVAPLKGTAVVFDSYDSMLSSFLDLWNFLSPSGVKEQKLMTHLLVGRLTILPPKLSASIDNYPGIKGRNPFQADLKIVSDLVLEDVARAGELEKMFLTECYSPSGALSQYALISKEILKTRYEALFENNSASLTVVSAIEKSGVSEELSEELLADSLSRRPILLIGDVGVGKTTFIRYLIKIEAKELFDNAIVLYFDLGTQATLTIDIREFILSEIEKQLLEKYHIDVDERNFVRGVYNLMLMRFKTGMYSDLLEIDPVAYKNKELEILEKQVARRDQHLKASIEHIAKARRQQVVVFIDNADQRTDEVQQQAFLIAQEIATNWSATVFTALRPETFYKSLKFGTLSGYHPKAFTISPPRIDRVIQKRLEFASKLASGEIPMRGLPSQTKVKFRNLNTIIGVFLESINYRDELMESIDNISGGNVRQALDFVIEFFSSGHVDTQKIINTYNEQGSYYIPLHEFLRAVIHRDAAYYDPDKSPIVNLFDVASDDPKEHFLLPFLLQTVISLGEQPSANAGFVEISHIITRLQNFGYRSEQIDRTLIRAYKSNLVETAGKPQSDSLKSIRASTIGAYHLRRLIKLFEYIDAMIVDTPVLIQKFRSRIHDAQTLEKRLERARAFTEYLDSQWEITNLQNDVINWRTISQNIKADINRIREKAEQKYNT